MVCGDFRQNTLVMSLLVLYWSDMESTQHSSVIGIDGGGTNCRFALLHNGQRVEVRGGSANASSDLATTRATLLQGLSDLARAADLDLDELRDFPAFIGLAGMVDATSASDLAQDLPLSHVQIEDDRRTALVGALGAEDGCVISIGTGSFLGRRTEGVERLVGGWGLVLGDEASGAFLGRQLLKSVVCATDGTTERSDLTQDALKAMGSTSAIVAFAATATPRDFARFAPDIVNAAKAGDDVAVALMTQGTHYIEEMLSHLGWREGERICLLGGLANHYIPYLSDAITAHLSEPNGSALDGALRLAAKMGGPA